MTNIEQAAYLGVRRIEQMIAHLEYRLDLVRFVGAFTLRWNKRDCRYEWRHREGRQYPVIGKERFEQEVAKLRAKTKGLGCPVLDMLLPIVGEITMRQEGRTLLNLVHALVTRGPQVAPHTLQLVWDRREIRARVTWTFGPTGTPLHVPNARAINGKPSPAYPAFENIMSDFTMAAAADGPWATEILERLVKPGEARERRLGILDAQMGIAKSRIRLYRSKSESWAFRQHTWPHGTAHASRATVEELLPSLPPGVRGDVSEALEVLAQRTTARQVARCIATLTDAAACWPSGQWTVQAHAQGAKRPYWKATAGGSRMLVQPRPAGPVPAGAPDAAEEEDEDLEEYIPD
jgi:hypothetical protein